MILLLNELLYVTCRQCSVVDCDSVTVTGPAKDNEPAAARMLRG